MIRYSLYNLNKKTQARTAANRPLATFWVYLMITSYFVVVPLGQLTTIEATDFRLYDLMFIIGFIFIILPNMKQILKTMGENPWIKSYMQLSLWLAIGLIIVLILKNLNTAIIGAARVIRFAFHGFVASVIVTFIPEKKTLYNLIWLFFILSVIQAVLSLLQFNGVLPTFFPSRWDYYGRVPTGTLGPHHLHMGMICAIAVCMGVSLAFIHRSIITRIAIAISLGLLTFATFAVESRTGTVGILIGLVYLFLRLLKKFSFDMIFMVFIIVIGIFFFYRHLDPSATFQIQNILTNKIVNPIEAEGIAGMSSTRVDLVKDLPRVISENPWVLITGTGTQNAVIVLKYGSALHNNYLHVLVEAGLLGLFLYLKMLFNIWKQSNHVYKFSGSEKGRSVNIGFTAAFIVILVSNLYNEAFYLQYASFSLSGQIMSLAAVCLHPAWLLSDVPEVNEEK